MIDDHTLCVGSNQRSIEGAGILEGILKNDRRITNHAHVAVGIFVVLYHGIKAPVNVVCQWLVQQLDSNNDVLVLLPSVLIGDPLDDGASIRDGVALIPANCAVVSAVVEPILGARCSMKIDPNFQACLPSPANCIVDVLCGPLDIWIIELLVCPV